MAIIDPVRLALHRAALTDMSGSRPKRLTKVLVYQSDDVPGAYKYATEEDFQLALKAATATDQLVEVWRKWLTAWDYDQNPSWSAAEPRTVRRRQDIYRLMELQAATAQRLDELIPMVDANAPVVMPTV